MQRSSLWLRSLAALSLCYWGTLSAQTLPYDHMHLAAADRAAAMAWYIENMDAKPHPSGDRVLIGDVMLVFIERDVSPRSEGSAVDHFGVSFPDLTAKMRALEAAGVKILAPMRDVPGLFKFAFVEDPWGVKIEVVEDPETLGFHHIHVNVPDPAQTFAWYAEHLGGVPASLKGRIDGLRFGEIWFLARQADAAPPSRGTAIDHLGWLVPDIEKTFADLKRKGVTITAEPRAINGVRAGLVEDGSGVLIDLVQRH
jgi:catechol 2,3-dioxygenase-like lactoylglutathione lyase family enzyme